MYIVYVIIQYIYIYIYRCASSNNIKYCDGPTSVKCLLAGAKRIFSFRRWLYLNKLIDIIIHV